MSEELIAQVQKNFKDARKHSNDWRNEAVELYDFVAGRQWDETDSALLKEQGRPEITFNRMGPYFDAVSGSETNNKQEIKYLPRTPGDAQPNETLTAAVKWVLDECNAGEEESDAFLDVLIPGMGWIETRMDYEDNPDGMISLERVDPLEMYWDPTSKKRNLQDAKWVARVKWMSKEEIEDKWPDADIAPSISLWDDDTVVGESPHNASLAFLYRNNATGYDEKTGKFRVVHHQRVETESVYRVIDPQSGKRVWLSKDKFDLAKSANLVGTDKQYVKQKKKKFSFSFICGQTVLEEGDIKCGSFTLKCITGKRDHNTNTWYGLGRVMKDPQKWANKFFSQILHIINSNAKGGLLAETGAFEDPRKAEQDWADPTAVVLLKNGALSGGKIKERTMASYPTGLDKMLSFAISSIPDVTGINLEFLGAADQEQAGILEQERKKAVYVILAGMFSSMRLYRKEEGRLLIHFVREYLNDGRIIRITTDQGEQAVPLNLDDDFIEYDVIVDQAPYSPNLKEQVWGTLSIMLPQLIKAGVPVPPELLDYAPIPATLAVKWKQLLMNKQVNPEQVQQMQQELQQLQQENLQLKTGQQVKMAQLESKHQLGQAKNQMETQKASSEFQIQLEMIRQQQQADFIKMQADFEAKMRKVMADAEAKVQIAHISSQPNGEAEIQQETELKKAALQAATQIEVAKINATKGAADDAEAASAATQVAKTSDIMTKILETQGKLLESVSNPKPRKITTPSGAQYVVQ